MSDGEPAQHELDELCAARERLWALSRTHAAVAGEPDLRTALQRIVVTACELAGARYAALGVLGEHGVLAEFVHTEMDIETLERVGTPPAAHGILASLISHPVPLRLPDLRTHPEATGFPPGQLVMVSFLGVPVRVREDIVGNLYLTASASARFSADDERLVVSLAAAAGVAIDNARLHAEADRHHRWLTIANEVMDLNVPGHGDQSLDLVLRHAQDAATADFAVLVEAEQLRVRAVTGVPAEYLTGLSVDRDGSLARRVVRSGAPVLTVDPAQDGAVDVPPHTGSVIVVPLIAGAVVGTLSVGRLLGTAAFTRADVDDLAWFADRVGLAAKLDHSRGDQQAHIIREQDRIADALNDHVIQELFAVGLGLHGLAAVARPEHRARINGYIDRLEAAIRGIRGTVLDLAPGRPEPDNGRRWPPAVADDLGTTVPATPTQPTSSSVSVWPTT